MEKEGSRTRFFGVHSMSWGAGVEKLGGKKPGRN